MLCEGFILSCLLLSQTGLPCFAGLALLALRLYRVCPPRESSILPAYTGDGFGLQTSQPTAIFSTSAGEYQGGVVSCAVSVAQCPAYLQCLQGFLDLPTGKLVLSSFLRVCSASSQAPCSKNPARSAVRPHAPCLALAPCIPESNS